MKQTMKLWMWAAILTCGFSLTSCVDDNSDNPVVPEPEVPVVPDHFINEAWMDRTVRPGDNFYMYALGTWLASHDEDDGGFVSNVESKTSALISNSLFTSDNPLAQHLVRNMKAPRPTLAEAVKAVLDHLGIQKPTGIGMMLTEIGRLQDKGLNPIFTKKEWLHAQTHTYAEMVTVGMLPNAAQVLLLQDKEDDLKGFIRDILTAIDEVSDPERMKTEGYDYLRYYAVMSVAEFARGMYGSTIPDDRVPQSIISRLGQISPLLMNQLNHDVLQKISQSGADRCRTMMEQMRTLFRQRIETLDWLSDATRQEALKKLEAMHFYVGVPEQLSPGEFTLDESNTLVLDALDIIAQNETIKRRLCGKKIEDEPQAAIDYETYYGEMNASYNKPVG